MFLTAAILAIIGAGLGAYTTAWANAGGTGKGENYEKNKITAAEWAAGVGGGALSGATAGIGIGAAQAAPALSSYAGQTIGQAALQEVGKQTATQAALSAGLGSAVQAAPYSVASAVPSLATPAVATQPLALGSTGSLGAIPNVSLAETAATTQLGASNAADALARQEFAEKLAKKALNEGLDATEEEEPAPAPQLQPIEPIQSGPDPIQQSFLDRRMKRTQELKRPVVGSNLGTFGNNKFTRDFNAPIWDTFGKDPRSYRKARGYW